MLLGGDGTLNRLVNDLDGYVPKNKLWLYKAGTGNDFYRDVKNEEELNKLELTKEYIQGVGNKLFNSKKTTTKKNEIIELIAKDQAHQNLVELLKD